MSYNQPFPEQLAFFRQKLNLPSERWDDIGRAAHDKAFIVAGAQGADLLADLRGAVDKAIEQGTGLGAFRKDFKALVAKHGWTGWTGEGSKGGEAWRTKVIYQTNMATSYAAGRWKQLNDPDLLKLLPYWQYKHSDSVMHPRPLHAGWNGLTLPPDHPFWKTHFPPNGWGCQCRIVAVSKADFMKAVAGGKGPANAPEGIEGIDKGFDYAPGANAHRPLKDFIDQKLIKLDAPVGAAMWEALKPALAMERQLAWWETLDTWGADEFARGRTAIVGAIKPKTLDWLNRNGKPIPASAEIAISDNLPTGVKQLRHEAAQNGLTLEEWRSLPALLDRPGAIYYDTGPGSLIFVADAIGPAKIAVKFDPKKLKTTGMNMVVGAFRVDDVTVAGAVKGGKWDVIEVSGSRAGVEPT